MVRSELRDLFLSFVRLGIGRQLVSSFKFQVLGEVDWVQLKALADQHGLSAVVLDGINEVRKYNDNVLHGSEGDTACDQHGANFDFNIPQAMLLQWIGEVMQSYEQRFVQYKNAIASLAGWYNQHGYKMMVLKGYGCSLNWPRPEHRPCGDLDIWLFGKQKNADAVLAKEKGVKIDISHHHHTVFEWQEFTVENHYDFLNVHHHKSNVELEKILKELGQDDSHYVEVYREKVYLPSANLHALFLLRHAMSNFASTGIKLRQLLDWAFFVEKHGEEIDWEWLENMLERFGMKKLYEVFNAICVEALGFDSLTFRVARLGLVKSVEFDKLKDRVLNDILEPEFSEKESGGFFSRALFKCRRWKANAWKHELCFSETLRSAFWSGVKGHLMKPASI